MNNKSDLVAETSYGKVRGYLNDGVYTFKGVRYAASTAGINRFMPPRKPEPWSDVKDCMSWGPLAPQSLGTSQANPATGMGESFGIFFGTNTDSPAGQSEDCLMLNVFTPGLGDGGKRPVMVWIHGGGFGIGTGSAARSDGTHLARRQNVVSVSITHRLGVMGYCHLDEFDPDFAHSGNVGQLDLVGALEWIRDNIEAFGGDPNRVMVHGESGGGGKIATLLGMPKAKDLFQSAILQSGTANRLPKPQKAAEYAEMLLKELQISKNEIKRLQQMPFEQLISAASQLEMRGGAGMLRGFVPVMGTADLPVSPLDAVAGGSAQIPIILGCTKHEMALMLMGSGTDPRDVTKKRLEGQINAMYGDKASELLQGYRDIYPDYSAGDMLVRIMTDATMRTGAIRMAEAHVKSGGAPTYMYMFTWESPKLPHLKAAHGIDGTFYFDNTETVGIAVGNPEAQTLAKRASTAWANFARDGKPSAEGLPDWPEYSLEKRETMVLSASPHVENDPMAEDRQLWERLAIVG